MIVFTNYAIKILDEMGHMYFFLDEMGLDEMGLDEMGINQFLPVSEVSL